MKNFSNIPCAFSVLVLLFFFVWCSGEEEHSVAPMEKTEKEALYSTIQGFVGSWWNGSDLYPDPCGWTPIQGVSCDLFDGFWYVTALHIGPIEENSLECAPEVKFRPDLFAFKRLKSLSFFSCFVSPSLHPVSLPIDSWEILSSILESLEFRSNPGLTGQIPTSFGLLRNLQSLVLLENGLTGELPTNIGNLTNLRRLVLSANGFKGLIPYSFGGLDKLLILDLSKNSLSGPLPLTFGGLTSLLKLDLSYNQLEGKIPSEIGNLRNLTLLDLSKNNFSGGLTQSFQELCSLEELLLSNNPIGGDLLSVEWHRLQGLVTLDLSNLGLTGGIPDSIAELKKLRFLGLNDNKLTGNLPPKLAAMPSVGSIYLNGNNLTGELKFSEEFYGKMGRRFGIWNNPNLCFPNGVKGSSSRGPYGVRQCDQEVPLHGVDQDSKSSLGSGPYGNLDQNSQSMASLGFPMHGADLFWGSFLVSTSIMILLL